MSKIKEILTNFRVLLIIFVALSILISRQSYFGGEKHFHEDGLAYTKYNNYLIFKSSFYHLLEGNDLYQLHPEDHFDLYKYSPVFAALMGVLAVLPDLLGLGLWNLLNTLVLFWAIWYLPRLDNYQKGFILAFILIELVTSLQNAQSNGLIAGLIVGAFAFFEKEKYHWGTLLLVLSFFVKIFGLVGFALCLLYPKKIKMGAYSLLWLLLLGSIPLFVVGKEQLFFLYQSWGELLQTDHSASVGLSVMGWLESWFGWQGDKNYLLGIGVLLFCLPLLRWTKYKEYGFRLLLLASVLIWVVIFNHKAESPTFIIAITGVAIWYFSQTKHLINTSLLVLSFLLTILSQTDLFPRVIREQWVIPYVLKVLPCILIWIKLIWDMSFFKEKNAYLRLP